MIRVIFLLVFCSCALMAQDSMIGSMHPKSGPYAPVEEANWSQLGYDLGSAWDGGNATFALYSLNATQVVLEIYAKPYGEDARYDYAMQRGSDNIWRAKIACTDNVVYYAFRLWGPNWPYSSEWKRGNSGAGFVKDVDARANRFNPNKVLYDPYGHEMSHDKSNPKVMGSEHNPGMFGTGDGLYNGVVRRNFDTGKWSPKSILWKSPAVSFGQKPYIHQKDAIIYEAHVAGLTKHPSSAKLKDILAGIPGMESAVNVPSQYKGTYKGAGYIASYLKALGFNTVELLPVHETDNDNNPTNSSGGNYWGYATYSFFAPDRRYAFDQSPGGPTKEFKEMVKAFHDAKMEVYLDVVYNHTGEGGTWDATGNTADMLCFRGLDNSQYYAIPQGAPHGYWESTGCGNNMDCSKFVVKKMVVDSLRYWITEMGIDGFRFDLATVLGRDILPYYDFNAQSPLLYDIFKIHEGTDTEMIAEAWDCSWPGGYQVGNFPFGWAEWNGKYRDSVRRFIKGGGVETGVADAINGSYNLYMDQGGPHKSVNFIVAHDGLTLMDLVSYNRKNNSLPWPFGPSDGGNDSNDCWDHAGNQALRRQQLRNLWTIQIFSRGVPMAVWGDEFGRTQNGNNNAYNLDSVATWNNYAMIATDSPHLVATQRSGAYHNNFGTDGKADGKNALFLFVQQLLQKRKAHECLRANDYRVSYHFAKADGGMLAGNDRAMRIHIDGSAVGDRDFLLLINTWTDKVDFTVFPADSGLTWHRVIDTASWAEAHNNFWAQDEAPISGIYGVNPWSVVVLEAR